MYRPRVIPVLLLRGSGLVKTFKFSTPEYVGDPLNAVRIFNEKEVDELVILDIMASRENRAPNFSLIAKLTNECFMPLCYGGGVSTIEEMRRLFSLGVEKISLNSAVLSDFSLLREAADIFGSQSVVASLDCKRALFKRYTLYSHAGRKPAMQDPVRFAKALEDNGAGEILLTSVSNDGVREGFDLELCRSIASEVTVPVVACGGGGAVDHFRQVLMETPVAAAAGGSFFVHHGKHRAVLITYPKPDVIQRLTQSGKHEQLI